MITFGASKLDILDYLCAPPTCDMEVTRFAQAMDGLWAGRVYNVELSLLKADSNHVLSDRAESRSKASVSFNLARLTMDIFKYKVK